MFFCEGCRVKNGWPENVMGFRSHGRCEVCEETAPCWDVPSRKLPKMGEDGVSKHTPGPWKAVCRDSGYRGGEWGREHFLQWEVDGPAFPSGRGNYYQADAYLVAAAPEAHEANVLSLVVLEDLWDALMSDRHPDMEKLNDALKANRAAIAKAKGRQP